MINLRVANEPLQNWPTKLCTLLRPASSDGPRRATYLTWRVTRTRDDAGPET